MKLLADKSYLWYWRTIILVLFAFIFINRVNVISRYNDSSWWGLVIVTFLSWIIIEGLLRYINVPRLTRQLLVIAAGAALYIDSFGTLWYLYENYEHYDWLVHGAVSAILTFWLWYIGKTIVKLPNRWHIWIVFTTAIFFGHLVELFEYGADVVWVRSHYWIGPAPDTVEDLLLNTIGAALVVFVLGWIEKRNNGYPEPTY